MHTGWGSDEAAPCISLMHGLIEQGQVSSWTHSLPVTPCIMLC